MQAPTVAAVAHLPNEARLASAQALLARAAQTDWRTIVHAASRTVSTSLARTVHAARNAPAARKPGATRRSAPAQTTLFGAVAVKFGSIEAAGRLSHALASGALTDALPDDCARTRCVSRIAAIKDAARSGGSFMDLVGGVNRAVNAAIRYRPDSETAGRLDHWAMPAETLLSGIGDCEDYAILKMAMLKQAGVPDRAMSIVVLKDTDRQLYHAVLTIRTNAGFLILDNVRDQVLFDDDLPQYAPLYSVSSAGNHIYGYRSGAQVAAASSLDSIAPGAGY
ncbi:MAG: transglutaminase-like cysteine peptidase [Roseitalea porphyridii]|uniref:transglutaminase-like cysteine peptidase n=1 Tax=Roseitalea porphyridii TaxID=1852022 RepID=UPI0032D991E5